MLKSQGYFVESLDNAKNLNEKILNISSLIPEKRNLKSSNFEQKWPITFIAPSKRVCSKSGLKISPKNKCPTKKSSVFLRLSTIPRPNVLNSYLSYKDILTYLDYLETRYGYFVKIHTIGTTYERRPIKCIEIDYLSEHFKNKRSLSAPIRKSELENEAAKKGRNIVFIEGGTHAREWLTVTVALNCIYHLTEKYVRHRNLLSKLKFYIVPVVNPDGYEYTRNVNHHWRKNRKPNKNVDHVGTDCNRNYDFHWKKNLSKPKRNTYQGDNPFSEFETKALATMLHSLAPNLLFFLSLHSYAQSIMYPFGYSKLLPDNFKQMESVAMAGRNAIKSFTGRHYRVGSISNITKRNISGSVVDYAHGAVKIPIALVMELPAKEYGFQPPVGKVNPLGMESWHGIKEMCLKAVSFKKQIEEEEIKQAVPENKTMESTSFPTEDVTSSTTKELSSSTTKDLSSSLTKDLTFSSNLTTTKNLVSCSTETDFRKFTDAFDSLQQKKEEVNKTSFDVAKNNLIRINRKWLAEGVISSMFDFEIFKQN